MILVSAELLRNCAGELPVIALIHPNAAKHRNDCVNVHAAWVLSENFICVPTLRVGTLDTECQATLEARFRQNRDVRVNAQKSPSFLGKTGFNLPFGG